MKDIKPIFCNKKGVLHLAIALVFGVGSVTSVSASLNKPIPSTTTAVSAANGGGTTLKSNASAAFVPNQVIIKLKPGANLGAASASASLASGSALASAPGLSGLMQKHGVAKSESLIKPSGSAQAGSQAASVMADTPSNGLDRIYVLTVEGGDVEKIAKEFAQDPSVEYAAPNHRASVQMVPNDTYYNSTGSFGQAFGDLWGVKTMAPEIAWDTTQGAGVTVAVIDTGVNISHEDLAANIWVNSGEVPGNSIDDDQNGFVDDVNGYDFIGASWTTPAPDSNPSDIHGHGTHVAGIIAAVGNNGKGVIGVAPKAKIMALRVLDNDGFGGEFQIAQAIIYAADKGARVINMSLGGSGASAIEGDAIAYAKNLGVVVLAAAGNESGDANYFAPANDANVITVGAINPQSVLASYSNFGPKIDVVAPGSDILSTLAPGSKIEQELQAGLPSMIVGQKYAVLSGTSMATPMVAGAAALMLAKSPALSPEEVRYRLKKNAVDMGSAGWDAKFGAGRVHASATVSDTSIASRTHAFIRSPSVALAAPSNTWVGNQMLTVTGNALGNQCVGFELGYAPKSGDTVGSFITIGSGAAAVNGNLGMLNASALADGEYILRLTARDANGTATTTYSNIVKDASLRAGWPSLASVWQGFAGIAMFGSNSMALSFTDLDNDGFKEVVSARGGAVYAWRRDGSRVPGFPANAGEEFAAPLAIADLDGDGKQEVVGIRYSDFATPIQVVGFDGQIKAGFPAGEPGVRPRPQDVLWSGMAPAVADLDGDGKKEIVFTARTMRAFETNYMYLNVIGYNGQQKAGWPKRVTLSNADLESLDPPKVTLADLDADGKFEVMVASRDSGGATHLLVYSAAGVLKQDVVMSGFTGAMLPEINVADMNKDGALEVFAASNTQAYLYNKSMTLLAGWPKTLQDAGVFANSFKISMIDVEANGDLEAVYLSRPDDTSGGVFNTSPQVMHAFKMNGSEATGYPSRFDPVIYPADGGGFMYNSYTTAVVDAPLTRSAGSSMFVNSFFSSFIGRSGAGAALSGWPKAIQRSMSDAAVGDLDNDGKLEIGTFSNDGMVYIYSEPGVTNKVSSWPTVNANNARTNSIVPTTAAFLKTYPQVYLRGTSNNWVGTTMTQTANYTWQIDATFGSTTTERFKLDIYNNWATNFGENNAGCTSNCVAELTGADIKITQGAGTYRIIFNDQTKAYSVVKLGANIAPVANAGPDQTVTLSGGAVTVTFNGSTSRDTDGSIVSYSWSNGLTGATPTKTYNVAGTYTVTLTVTDNKGATATDTVVILVKAPNQAPIARAGNDQTANGAATVTLDGSASSDPDGTITGYQWVQTAGPAVTIQNATQARAQVTLPAYPGMPTVFSFKLTVTDNLGLTSSSTTNVQQIEGAFQSAYTKMYFRGTPNNFLGDKPMTLVANYIWQIDIPFSGAATDRFKFDVFANWATNFGDNNRDGIAEAGGADIYVTVAGTYRIRFNDQTKAYTVVKL